MQLQALSDAVKAQLIHTPDWMPADLEDLHPDLHLPLLAAVQDARSIAGLRIRKVSGWRSNVQQKALRDAYEAHLAAVKAGTEHVPPLPAACPGHSAHNFTLCTEDSTHTFGEDEACAECGSDGVKAALAADIEILDHAGTPIRSGGAIPLEERPREWQLWPQVLERHTGLRDGGAAYKDPVHVEDVRWNDHTFTLDPAPDA